MSINWKPGDVAVLAMGKGGSVPIRAIRANGYWVDKDGVTVEDIEPWGVAPLVVIDPEDGEQVDRLTKTLVEKMYAAGDERSAAHGVHPATVAATLRALVPPPKPEEPTGLGAVVEDVEGLLWVRDEGPGAERNNVWYRYGEGASRPYERVAVVRVLSEGVSA